MRTRADAEVAGITLLLLLCGAFMVSFVIGLGGPSRPASSPAPATELTAGSPPPTGRLEVLNASGRSGLARAATARLRDGRFDVVHFGNAVGFSGDSSLVIARTGDGGVARAVARHLGIDSVLVQHDATLLVDATVILGRDWPVDGHGERKAPTWRGRIGRWLRPAG